MSNKKIIVIDDEDSFLKLIRLILEPEGFDVDTASDGQDGIAKMYECLPDLVLLDINLPKMDGYEVCQKIRSDNKLKSVPIIMLTIRNKPEEEIKGLNLGSDDYISKPFQPQQLVTRIKMVLRRVIK